jgi:hypothetical protein
VTHAQFKFVSDAITGGDQFPVVSFFGRERVSELYRYEIEVKAHLSADINLDDVLDFGAFKTVQNFVHYKGGGVPKIWQLSDYTTNGIFYEVGVEGEVDAGQTIAAFIA